MHIIYILDYSILSNKINTNELIKNTILRIINKNNTKYMFNKFNM